MGGGGGGDLKGINNMTTLPIALGTKPIEIRVGKWMLVIEDGYEELGAPSVGSNIVPTDETWLTIYKEI